MSLKILHTSDWHIGKSFYNKERSDEIRDFLEWLLETLDEEKIDVLLMAGDVFDTTNPKHSHQKLFNDFLKRTKNTHCRHVVGISGNHDSAELIESVGKLGDLLDIHLLGDVDTIPKSRAQREVAVLRDKDGNPELIVCAVPFVLQKNLEIRAYESIGDNDKEIKRAILQRYQEAWKNALAKKAELGVRVPMVFMGHLFAQGGWIGENDGMQNSTVGSLSLVAPKDLPLEADYIALGHLHRAQVVDGLEHVRYSGTPFAMNFSEAGQKKSVELVEFFPPGTGLEEAQSLALENTHARSGKKDGNEGGIEAENEVGNETCKDEISEDMGNGSIPYEFKEDDEDIRLSPLSTPGREKPKGADIPMAISVSNGGFTRCIWRKAIPRKQHIVSIKSSSQDEIKNKISGLRDLHESVWLSVNYTNEMRDPFLKKELIDLCDSSMVELVHFEQRVGFTARAGEEVEDVCDLERLTPELVFDRLCEESKIGEVEKLRKLFDEVLFEVRSAPKAEDEK